MSHSLRVVTVPNHDTLRDLLVALDLGCLRRRGYELLLPRAWLGMARAVRTRTQTLLAHSNLLPLHHHFYCYHARRARVCDTLRCGVHLAVSATPCRCKTLTSSGNKSFVMTTLEL
jgi:hypothetical protein